ncbi:hypothetical protein ABEG18_05295 [Alsobacter sp. KACC 23698]|uniref:4-aminobutyrate aminotransferase n=1 Tax=Alsobacter sp. KACC 23698 TaxID=3149229 RepID=A0AAU7JJ25_9HYPH
MTFVRLAAATLLLAGCAAQAQAQTQAPAPTAAQAVSHKAEVEPGQDAQLGIFGGLNPDCTPVPVPDIRIVKPPTKGTVIIRAGRTTVPASAARCAGVDVPVQALFFRGEPKFAGPDVVTVEVGSGPRIQTHIIDVVAKR